ncbi:hypothetical protein WMY93_000625 [Mugilogobius chulae]|uniref:C-type lectin domain-containing protein n=1 Tax=Mugilogobius chulae TaxID=88201 RepID=A0AAW0Q2Z2_9GOBI
MSSFSKTRVETAGYKDCVYGQHYLYIDLHKTWHDAQKYCRENYLDLAILHNMEDIQLLSRPAAFSSAYAWTGLSDEEANWSKPWGAPTTRGTGARRMSSAGIWRDVNCNDNMLTVCFTKTESKTTFTYLNIAQSWSSAVNYCRQHYTDLAMIEDAQTDSLVKSLASGVNVWIGLTRVPWIWADGASLTYNMWQGGKPINTGTQHCVKEDATHRWVTASCSELNPFICIEVSFHISKFTVRFQSSANLTDPFLQSQILQKLVQVLEAHSVRLSKPNWSIQPRKL